MQNIIYLYRYLAYNKRAFLKCARRSMDRTSIFGIDDVGSIPAGRTTKSIQKLSKLSFIFVFIKQGFYAKLWITMCVLLIKDTDLTVC